MPNYGYHFARAHGGIVRRTYSGVLPWLSRRPISPPGDLPFDIFSYSSEKDLPEQVASIRSLLKFGGCPRRFTVISDGSHSACSIALLEAISPAIAVKQSREFVPEGVSPAAVAYLTEHPTGKQLALIMSLPQEGPALYLDCDVLFFPGAQELVGLRTPPLSPALYLLDCQLSADERLLRGEAERQNPLNTGVLFLRERLDWTKSFERLREFGGDPIFFTNQTMTHLSLHAAGASPLDRAKYVLQLDDQFVYPDWYAGKNIVLRHYVRPIRHKFWTTLGNRGLDV